MAAPPRLHADLGERGLIFTAGGYVEGPVGFRVYGLWPGDSDQAVLVWGGNGRLAGALSAPSSAPVEPEHSVVPPSTRSPVTTAVADSARSSGERTRPPSESSAAVSKPGRD